MAVSQPIVTVQWDKPKTIEESIDDCLSIKSGVYCISRVFGNNETLLYIGKSSGGSGCRGRLKRHYEEWTGLYRGNILVRLGTITKETLHNIPPDEIIEDVESALIFETSPPENKSKVLGYSRYNYLIIKNRGSYNKMFKSSINTLNHDNEDYINKLPKPNQNSKRYLW